jgi:hypothetical protein
MEEGRCSTFITRTAGPPVDLAVTALQMVSSSSRGNSDASAW